MAILRPLRRLYLAVIILCALTVVLFSTSPSKLSAITTVRQTFIMPTSDTITQRFRPPDNPTHNGVDIQSTIDRPQISDPYDPNMPTAEDLRCLAEPGSVDNLGQPITRGDYNPSDGNNRCDDWQGAVVNAASAGLVTSVEASVDSGHVVRIFHGTLADGRMVETVYLHLGTKVRDGRNINIGEPRRSFITVNANSCVQMGDPIGYQGYSGRTTATHLHYSVKVGGVYEDPEDWFNRNIELTPPTECARAVRPGFNTNVLPANDDGSTGAVALPFTVNFFGGNYGALFVNNNGNLTFDASMFTYTPFPLLSTNHAIIAPFFADVDTRVGNVVTYGPGTVGDRPAFGVTWPDVGCYSHITSVLNKFQVVLIDRSDIGSGDFDIEFNYDKIQWETGQASGGNSQCQFGSSARVGYSNGVDRSFELPGSGVNGAFLDSNLTTGLIHNNRNSFQTGRYIFPVRNSVAPTGGTISGTVFQNPPLPGAFVQACKIDGFCNTTTTNLSGQYSVSGLAAGQYNIRAFPPTGTNILPGEIGPITLATGQTLTGQDIHLTGPTPPPPGTTITSRGTGSGGVPVVPRGVPLTLTTQGCPGGTASYQILQNGVVIQSGGMTENSAGTYTATVAPLSISGNAHVVITILCPDATTTTTPFDVIYIDPSGTVVDQGGSPIAGATVRLYRSDNSIGPFEQVPDGSGIMSIANRNNPDTTDAAGHFGWDVIAGFYIVRAEATGCVSPADPSQSFVETGVLTIPPPVTNLLLVLDCNNPPTANAGPDQTLEATSPAGAIVSLDGTNSSDPGDALTFFWSAPGIAFDDPTSTTPTATFPLGITTVTLTVTDQGGLSDTDTVDITIMDTTPPTLTAPSPITLECNTTGGIPTSDPAVQAWLNLATATDIVDPSPTLTNDAPSFCALGDTVVTFTATDFSGNSTSTSSTITVVDTTAPTVTAALVPACEPEDADDDNDDTNGPCIPEVGEDEGFFQIQFSCSDVCDANPTASATLNGIPVSNGQIVKLELEDDDEGQEVEIVDGILEIEAPSFTLTVTCTDASGNVGMATATPVFAEDEDE